MIKDFKIPEQYYKYGTPIRTHYLKEDNEGLRYKVGGEEAFEMSAAFGGDANKQFLVISLLSPYVLGFENIGKEKRLIDVDIDKRIVTVDII